jgi:hypothetical protein
MAVGAMWWLMFVPMIESAPRLREFSQRSLERYYE